MRENNELTKITIYVLLHNLMYRIFWYSTANYI